jgi:hypothetical protein
MHLAPFLYTQQKIYLTTASFHNTYLRFMQTESGVNCARTHVSRRSLGGFEMCVVMDT